MKKWWILLLALALPFNYALYHTHLKRTRGFSIDKILPYKHPHHTVWDVNYSDAKLQSVKAILSRPFTYFGSGKTCYVFVSEDQKYVIKLFKQRHMRPFSWFEKMAGFQWIPLCKAKLQKRLDERMRLFTSFKIAHNYLQEETGLVYLHLQPTKNLNQTLFFSDKAKRPFTFDADEMEFLIQKRAERTFPVLTQLIESGQTEKALAAIQSIKTLIKSRCEKYIDDDDNNCERNIGLIDGKAVEIDIGEFALNPRLTQEDAARHIEIATRDLYQFLKTHHPDFYELISNESVQNTR